MAGLIIHLFLTLPLLLKFVGRVSPQIHYRNMSEAMLMAFSTSSSSATLPVTLRCAEEKVGVSNRISSFVLPMGSTINMDGTALYECVGVIFIAQVMGIPLDLHAQIVVVVTALLASIGAAGIPSAGLVMIFIITDAIHLQGPQVGLIVGAMLAVDRPLDMFRTMVNVTSDSCGAAIIAKSEGEGEVDAGIR
jgi:Na+/H+-dicarboxylate symporter